MFVLQPRHKYTHLEGVILHRFGAHMQHPMHVHVEVKGPAPLFNKCYPEGVEILLLILEHIEVVHAVDESNRAAKPAKS